MKVVREHGYCHKCGTVFHYAIPRGWFLRKVLGFLPVRKYFCAKCLTVRYTWGKEYEA